MTPAINFGLVEFVATAALLVASTTNCGAVKAAIDSLRAAPKTSTGTASPPRCRHSSPGRHGDGRRRRPATSRGSSWSRTAPKTSPWTSTALQRTFTAARTIINLGGSGRYIIDCLLRHVRRLRVVQRRRHSGSGGQSNPAEDLRDHRRSSIPRLRSGLAQAGLFDSAAADWL